MSAYVPPGWPTGVHPPGSEDFERTAQAWLLDAVPPDYRLHGVLRRYPLALAAMAVQHTRACVAGARDGYRTARTELGDALPPHALDAVLAAYRAEGRRLVAAARAADLVARALRGEVFTPQLQEGPPPGRGADRPGREAAANGGIVDLRPKRDQEPNLLHATKIGRMRKLNRLGLARQVGGGQWVLVESAEQTLRQLGERNDIIKRIHRGLSQHGWVRGTWSFVLTGDGGSHAGHRTAGHARAR